MKKEEERSKIVNEIENFVLDSAPVMQKEKEEWILAQEMYESCFDVSQNKSKLFNPVLLADILDRVIGGLKLTDYMLRIPGRNRIERSVTRDYINQVEEKSGLSPLLRDGNEGSLSWALFGNVILTWGKADDKKIKEGIPVEFKTIKLSNAYFPRNAERIRDYNGNAEVREFFCVYEDTYENIKRDFPFGKKNGAFTGEEFQPGQLSFVSIDNDLQTEEFQDLSDEKQITQIGCYYNIDKGIFYTLVGKENTIVEAYDDEDKSFPKYPFKMDGENYIPVEILRIYEMVNSIYGKGIFAKFAKIARNDAERRNKAYKYVDGNLNPDKFIKMDPENYSTFANDLAINRELQEYGEDSYVQIGMNDEIQTSDFRSAPLSQEFERMKADTLELVIQGGISINDVDRPATQTATQTVSEERSKRRLFEDVQRRNASASTFLRKVILQFIKDYIKENNKSFVATNTKMEVFDTVEAQEKGLQMEIELDKITCGEVAQFIRDNEVFIQQDFSSWDNIRMKMSKINAALPFSVGTPVQMKLQEEALEALGFQAFTSEVKNLPQDLNNMTNEVRQPRQLQPSQAILREQI